MPHIAHKKYTKPIPEGAELVTVKGVPSARFKGTDGKTMTVPLSKKGDRIQLESAKWYGFYVDANSKPQEVPLFTDKVASQQKLAELVRKVELHQAGIIDPFEAHRKRPLLDHVSEWEQAMRNDGAGEKHVQQTGRCVRRLIAECKFAVMGDLSASRVQQFLADLRKDREPLAPLDPLDPAKLWYTKTELARVLHVKPGAIPPMVKRHKLEATGNGKARRYAKSAAEFLRSLRSRGASIKTSNLYLDAIKSFCRWMVQDRRMGESPLEHLSGGNVKLDRRHDRRILDEGELRLVILTARSSAKVFRGMNGEDRGMVYAVACIRDPQPQRRGFCKSELLLLQEPAQSKLNPKLGTAWQARIVGMHLRKLERWHRNFQGRAPGLDHLRNALDRGPKLGVFLHGLEVSGMNEKGGSE